MTQAAPGVEDRSRMSVQSQEIVIHSAVIEFTMSF
jgi:hypothetical protein